MSISLILSSTEARVLSWVSDDKIFDFLFFLITCHFYHIAKIFVV